MKILVIDDSKAMRSFLRFLIQEFHMEAVEAEDGVFGLEALMHHPDVALALVDWDMPRMNGLEFVTAVRGDPAHNAMKLMMVTTQNSMDRVASALQAGADDYLMKPVTKEALEDKLRMLGFLE